MRRTIARAARKGWASCPAGNAGCVPRRERGSMQNAIVADRRTLPVRLGEYNPRRRVAPARVTDRAFPPRRAISKTRTGATRRREFLQPTSDEEARSIFSGPRIIAPGPSLRSGAQGYVGEPAGRSGRFATVAPARPVAPPRAVRQAIPPRCLTNKCTGRGDRPEGILRDGDGRWPHPVSPAGRSPPGARWALHGAGPPAVVVQHVWKQVIRNLGSSRAGGPAP